MAISALIAGVLMSTFGGGTVDALAVGGGAPQGDTAVPFTTSAETHPPSYDTPTPSHSGAQKMADLVNDHRRANGVAPLVFDVAFSDRTEPFAIAMASAFPPPEPPPGWDYSCPSVDLFHDTSPAIWASVPPGTLVWGENVAYRCGSNFDKNVEKAFERLVASDRHNANMLSPRFTHMAISVVHFGKSTFVVQRFAEVPGTVPPVGLTPPSVRSSASCFVGKGRIDIEVANPNSTAASYAVRVTGTQGFSTNRYIDVGANQTGRVAITGRFDGVHDIAVRPKDQSGADPVMSSVEIKCGVAESTRPVEIRQSCLQENGRIDVYITNRTSTTKTYVVELQSGSVRDRLITLAGGASDRITVTGRPDGKIPVTVYLGGAILHREEINIACDT